MKLRTNVVELRSNRTDYSETSIRESESDGLIRVNLLVVRRKGDLEQTSEGVWNSGSKRPECIYRKRLSC